MLGATASGKLRLFDTKPVVDETREMLSDSGRNEKRRNLPIPTVSKERTDTEPKAGSDTNSVFDCEGPKNDGPT